jgi:hypothetical protein
MGKGEFPQRILNVRDMRLGQKSRPSGAYWRKDCVSGSLLGDVRAFAASAQSHHMMGTESPIAGGEQMPAPAIAGNAGTLEIKSRVI